MDISVKGKNLDVDTAPAAHVGVPLDGTLNSALDRMTEHLRRDKRNIVNHHVKRRAAEEMPPTQQYGICADDDGIEIHQDALPTDMEKCCPRLQQLPSATRSCVWRWVYCRSVKTIA